MCDKIFVRHYKGVKPMPKIMILGTMSNVGKSLITTALCRYFANKGLNVSPFKAQNMSLNSIVSIEGGEMALSQYIQAISAKKEPSVKMNPILLKPDPKGTQVIINGKVLKTSSSREYMYSRKDEIFKIVLETFMELQK